MAAVLLHVIVLVTLSMATQGSKVLLVSMDGFRWDYINQVSTPAFDAMATEGARAPYLNTTFVTKTFPCHFSIATGLYEESHGIIANSMYDPDFDETFNKGTKDPKWWNAGEPIWVTARKHNLKSAVYYWPGSETKIRGFYPTIYKTYNQTVPFTERIDAVVDWFTHQDVDFAMLYFHEPDATGHQYGPDSPEVRQKVAYMDTILAELVKKFDDNGLLNTVNVLVTSDHGMAEVDTTSRVIDLSQHVDLTAIDRMPDEGPISHILPVAGREDEIVRSLTGVDHLSVYRREDIPDHWHYKNNRRILPILVVADEGWMVVRNAREHSDAGLKGAHGYDNFLSSMKPIFYARGPDVKSNSTIAPFNSVDIYPLVCRLLGIQPAPNNGSLDNTRSLLLRDPWSSGASRNLVCLRLIAVLLFLCSFFIA